MEVLERAASYKRSCLYLSKLHYDAVDTALRYHHILGIPVVIATTIVTTSIFATLNSSPSIGWKITAGIISLIGTVLSALQAFLRFSERASDHKATAASYRALGRRFDLFILRYSNLSGIKQMEFALNELEKLANMFSDIAENSPHVTVAPDKRSEIEIHISGYIP